MTRPWTRGGPCCPSSTTAHWPSRSLIPRATSCRSRGYALETAACLSTAWLTAYRMLFTNSGVQPGERPGPGRRRGAWRRRWCSWGRRRVPDVGHVARRGEAHAGRGDRGGPGVRVRRAAAGEGGRRHGDGRGGNLDPLDQCPPAGRDGRHLRGHVRDAAPQGRADKIYFRQLRVVGSTMGNRAELERLARFVADHGIEPVIDSVHPLADARDGFARIADGRCSARSSSPSPNRTRRADHAWMWEIGGCCPTVFRLWAPGELVPRDVEREPTYGSSSSDASRDGDHHRRGSSWADRRPRTARTHGRTPSGARGE